MPSRRTILNRLDELVPGNRRAFERAITRIRDRTAFEELVRAVEAKDVQRIARALGMTPGVWSTLTESLRATYMEGGNMIMDDAPAALGLAFDMDNPRATRWLSRNAGTKITGRLTEETLEAIRVVLGAGSEAGRNPRQTAYDLAGRINRATGRRAGGIIGLNKPQSQALMNMKRILETDPREYFIIDEKTGRAKPRFKLADKRFTGLVRRAAEGEATLSQADINRITTRYHDNLLRYRGEMIARTETLQAYNAGQNEAYQQALDQGALKEIQRFWDAAGDARTRPAHMAAEQQPPRGMNEAFLVGGTPMMYPGDPAGGAANVINCRCVVRTEVKWAEER